MARATITRKVQVMAPTPPPETALGQIADGLGAKEWALLEDTWPDGGPNVFWRHSDNTGHAITPYANVGLWDATGRQMIFIGNGHVGTITAPVTKMIVYDEASDTWTGSEDIPAYANGMVHTYDHLTLDPARRHVYLGKYLSGDLARLDLSTMTWASMPGRTNNGSAVTVSLQWFPERDSLICINPNSSIQAITELKYGAASWTSVAACPYSTNYHNISGYDHVRGCVYFGGGGNNPNAFFRLNADGTVNTLASCPLPMDTGVPSSGACDPVTGRFLVIRQSDGAMAEYIPESNTWASVATSVPSNFLSGIGNVSGFIVPIFTYGVFMFVQVWDGKSVAYIYKHTAS